MKYTTGFFFVCLLSFSQGRKPSLKQFRAVEEPVIGKWSEWSDCSISTRTRTCEPEQVCAKTSINLVETNQCSNKYLGAVKRDNSTTGKREQQIQFDVGSNAGNTLGNGETLKEGNYLSTGNCYYAVFQLDGNFVLYVSKHWVHKNALWSTSTAGDGRWTPRRLVMQDDGNLVIYDAINVVRWASDSHGKGSKPYRLVLQEDGNLVIYDRNNAATWSSNTSRG